MNIRRISPLFCSSKVACNTTRASTKVFSISQVLSTEVVKESFWEFGQIQEGQFISHAYLLPSTSYGQVITAALLALLGLYELFHFFFKPFKNAIQYFTQWNHIGYKALPLQEVEAFVNPWCLILSFYQVVASGSRRQNFHDL